MLFIPDITIDTVAKIGVPLASAVIGSGMTYLIFNRTMAANVRARFDEAQASFIAAIQARLKECEDHHEKSERRFSRVVPPLIRILMNNNIEIPKSVLDEL